MRTLGPVSWLSVAGLCALAAGCATAGPETGLDTAQVRGRDLAERQCMICHTPTGSSGGPSGAPSFAQLGRRYNPLTFQRRVREVAGGAHYQMPPSTLTPEEAEDIGAYIDALAASGAR